MLGEFHNEVWIQSPLEFVVNPLLMNFMKEFLEEILGIMSVENHSENFKYP